jgi:hypothetical protein
MAALDAQSNWNVEMSQPLRIPIHSKEKEKHRQMPPPILLKSQSSREVLLPLEIISYIIAFIPHRLEYQGTFWACALISRSWYSATIATLYDRPWLHGGNFNEFVTTVCPSKNAHIRHSHLAALVKRLDMGELVQFVFPFILNFHTYKTSQTSLDVLRACHQRL